MKRAYIAVATRSHWPWIRVLAERLRRVDPDTPLHVCMADGTPGSLLEGTGVRCCCPADLNIPEVDRFCFQYSAFELCCALKPFLLEYALKTLGYETIIYLDTDIWIERPLAEAWEAMESCELLLSPHLPMPLPTDVRVGLPEVQFFRTGVFNAGFVGVRRGEASRQFLAWWCERLQSDCIVDLRGARFVDQLWLSLASGMFDQVRVFRHPAYNVAFWNMAGRLITGDFDHDLRIDGMPLVMLHFTGFNPADPARLSSHSARELDRQETIERMKGSYAKRLAAAGWSEDPMPYGWGTLTDGTPIDPAWRESIRVRHAKVSAIADPFEAKWKPAFEAAACSLVWGRQEMREAAARDLLQRERDAWKRAYLNLSRAFPIRQLLILRRLFQRGEDR